MGSRLVIDEKRLMKSKGFGSVLFQFFDWNRMLTKKKKKLFSDHKLLLLPSASKKFDGGERMAKSKHFLVADENLECFPISRKLDGHINQLRDAGPVAKLMGLESMPIVHHKKPIEPSLISEFNSNRYEASEVKESRPQKVQRTGGISSSSESSHSNKRVRRHYHHMIASPVKSPRLLSKRSTSRLRLNDEKVTKDVSLGDSGVGPSRCFHGLNGSMKLRLNDAENKMKLLDTRKPVVIPRGKERPTSLDVPKINVERRARGMTERKNYIQDGRKREILRQNQLPTAKGKVVYGSKRRNGEMGNGLNNVKESCTERLEVERNGTERKNKGPERRPNDYSQNENGKATSSAFGKELNARSNLISGKGKGAINNCSINHSPVKSGFKKQEESNGASESEGNGIISFTFSSPMSRSSRPIRNEDILEKRCVDKPIHKISRSKMMASDDGNIHSKVSQREAIPRGDSLSVLLRQKIEELSNLDRDKFPAGGALKGRSTASIPGELITALKIGQEYTACSGSTSISDHITSHGQMVKSNSTQIEVESGVSAVNLVSDGDQPSPMSILEASFSNDSCLSRSPNGSSGHKPDFGSTDNGNNIQPLNLDADLLDSASSSHIEKLVLEKTHGSVTRNHVNEDIVPYEVWFSECKLSTEAKSNARLLIGNFSLSVSIQKDTFIFDTLEAITTALGITDARRLLFDCMLECVDSQCIGLFASGSKISLLTGREELARAVCDEIQGWNGLIGKEMDDIVDKDLRDSNGTWTKFKHEAFVTCVQIENELLHELVGEMVTDLCS